MVILKWIGKSVLWFAAAIGVLSAYRAVTGSMHGSGHGVHLASLHLGDLETALGSYRLDVGRYPTTEEGLDILVDNGRAATKPPGYRTGGYMDRLPQDPWGASYQYLNVKGHPMSPLVCSLGSLEHHNMNVCRSLNTPLNGGAESGAR